MIRDCMEEIFLTYEGLCSGADDSNPVLAICAGLNLCCLIILIIISCMGVVMSLRWVSKKIREATPYAENVTEMHEAWEGVRYPKEILEHPKHKSFVSMAFKSTLARVVAMGCVVSVYVAVLLPVAIWLVV